MTEQTMQNAKKLHGALLVAADAAGAHVQMLEVRAHSERYTDDMNTAMISLLAVVREVSAHNAEIATEEAETEDAAAAMLAELEAEADAEFEAEQDAAELEADIVARIKEENAAAIEAIEVQNVANGLSVDDDRFMDGINRAEDYLPPLSALSEDEQQEVAEVLDDATPFPGCVEVVGDCCEGTAECSFDVPCRDGGTSECVQAEPAAETAEAIAPAASDSVRSGDPYSGVNFGNLQCGYVPPVLGEGIFSLAPETD